MAEWINIVDVRKPEPGQVVQTCGHPVAVAAGTARVYYRKYIKGPIEGAPHGRWTESFETVEAARACDKPHRRMMSAPTWWRAV